MPMVSRTSTQLTIQSCLLHPRYLQIKGRTPTMGECSFYLHWPESEEFILSLASVLEMEPVDKLGDVDDAMMAGWVGKTITIAEEDRLIMHFATEDGRSFLEAKYNKPALFLNEWLNQ